MQSSGRDITASVLAKHTAGWSMLEIQQYHHVARGVVKEILLADNQSPRAGRRRAITDSEFIEIRRRYENGETLRAIAPPGVSFHAVQRALIRAGVPRRHRGPVPA